MINIDTDTIKDFIRDKAEFNLLYDNVEQFNDELYDVVLPMVEEEIRINFPALMGKKIPNSIIIKLTIAYLMQSESFVQLRNQVSVSDNNNNGTSLYDKEQNYLQLSDVYRKAAYTWLSNMAKTSYYQECWDSVHSNAMDMENANNTGYGGWSIVSW